MTQAPPPPGHDDNNETVALNRGDLPPGGFGQGGQQPPPAQQYGQQPPPQSYGQAPPPQQYGQSGQPGQPQYGQPAPAYGQPVAPRRSVGVAALVLAGLGVVAALVGMFAVNWFRNLDQDLKFLDIKDSLDDVSGADWSKAFFGWAAFVLLAVALVSAVVAALPSGASGAFRALGAVIGLAGAAYTILAPKLDGSDNYGEVLKQGLGMYFVAGGFVLLAIGSLIGSRRTV